MFLQAANNIPSDQSLDAADDEVDERDDPDDLPVLVLHSTGIASRGHMHAYYADEGPVEGEPPHRVAIVEVCGLLAAHRERPVE
jgi:hypothetical protein